MLRHRLKLLTYNGSPQRLGDKFTVVGSAANNSLTIYASAATNTTGVPYNVVYRWTTTDLGATFVRDSIVLTGVSTTAPGSTPAVYPLTRYFRICLESQWNTVEKI